MKFIENVEIPLVREIMTSNIIALGEDHSPVDALNLFNKYRVSSMPVMSSKDSHRIVGFLSEADCMKWASNCLFHDERQSCCVSDVMSSQVKLANERWDIFELESFFEKEGLRHAPVENANGNVVGIVSRRDVLNRLQLLLAKVSENLKARKEPIHLSMTQELQLELGSR